MKLNSGVLLLSAFLPALFIASAGVARGDDGKSPSPESHAVSAATPLALGKPAPMAAEPMKAGDGQYVSIGGVAGKKGTLVIFTCNHCPWVKAWQARIAAIGNAALEGGIGVVAVNPNDPGAYPEDDYEQTRARAKALGFKFAYAVDSTSEVARAFGATHTPEVFLFDASGRLVYHGGVDDNARDEKAVQEHWLQDAVAAVAAGKPVRLAETKALGCSVKLRAREKSGT
ncbi:MAG: thioredoxin family protein [Candidatus Eisenbacteria bacterium]|nr:thioredoxin family protein [Candidatus Eisenbacteria bacterium]